MVNDNYSCTCVIRFDRENDIDIQKPMSKCLACLQTRSFLFRGLKEPSWLKRIDMIGTLYGRVYSKRLINPIGQNAHDGVIFE
jgi:hypothetical protein